MSSLRPAFVSERTGRRAAARVLLCAVCGKDTGQDLGGNPETGVGPAAYRALRVGRTSKPNARRARKAGQVQRSVGAAEASQEKQRCRDRDVWINSAARASLRLRVEFAREQRSDRTQC